MVPRNTRGIPHCYHKSPSSSTWDHVFTCRVRLELDINTTIHHPYERQHEDEHDMQNSVNSALILPLVSMPVDRLAPLQGAHSRQHLSTMNIQGRLEKIQRQVESPNQIVQIMRRLTRSPCLYANTYTHSIITPARQ